MSFKIEITHENGNLILNNKDIVGVIRKISDLYGYSNGKFSIDGEWRDVFVDPEYQSNMFPSIEDAVANANKNLQDLISESVTLLDFFTPFLDQNKLLEYGLTKEIGFGK
jgi:hypothetical protein